MKGNDFQLCGWTPSHLGWGTGVGGFPALKQSRFGTKGNFELAVPSRFSGIDFLWRNNDVPSMPWSEPSQFGHATGHVDALTMIQSNYGEAGARTKRASDSRRSDILDRTSTLLRPEATRRHRERARPSMRATDGRLDRPRYPMTGHQPDHHRNAGAR